MNVIPVNKPNKWLAFSNPPDAPSARLLCFPYGGGAASAYRTWQVALGSEIEVCPVQLPGREGRFGEPACTDVNALIDAMFDNLMPLFDKPVFFFGYSLGAAIAYKLAAYCKEHAVPVDLKGLICCARKAPARKLSLDVQAHLSDDEFLDHIVSLGGTAESTIQHASLRGIALRLLRSDFLLSASVIEPFDEMIDAPLTVVGGSADPTVPREELNNWRRVTSGRYRCEVLPGGHFFMNEDIDRFMALLRDVLGVRRHQTIDSAIGSQETELKMGRFMRSPPAG